ncbi:hypothetical protein Vretimale_954 [Volvox reticuliferus]|uniref:EF-hand domain-containing protein n=1 Tax=Volvox reticuliferus TaxID=1737510 RepID=A0A8J4D9M2_9CHLO|nr:hypothetical protein Vretifemale_10505 [Volvox reticuliferus]GIL94810.1 hypothetical protein Vretimale_954 [Volvox reticuliferus]
MTIDADGVPEDFDDLVGEDSILGGSNLSGQYASASNKVPSKPPSNADIKAPSEAGTDDSFFASGSRQPSRQASKAASNTRMSDSLKAPPKASSSAGSAWGGSGVGSPARNPSARPSTAGSHGRPTSPLGTTPSDDFADILGPSTEKSSASLPRGPPSTAGSGFGVAAGAGAGGAVTGARPPSAPVSGRPSPAGTPAMSRPDSLRGFGASGFGSGSRTNGSFSPMQTLASPEASPSPRAPQTPLRAKFAAGVSDGESTQRRWPLSQSGKSRISQVECHVPTPFELFRLYDADLNGRVTREEFFSMMRDLDGYPLHYAPHDDPEHRLAELREKRGRKEVQRAAREEKLSLAELHRQANEEMKREMAAEVAKLAAEVGELDARIAEEETELKQLVHHADESVRVTPELRQHRAHWRSWVQDEFKRADLAGNGILSIDEFYMYFYAKLCFRFPVMRTGVNPGALLFNVFVRYCSIGRGAVGGRNEDMLSHQFSKLCRDAGLINGKAVTKATVDIIYHRARAADESLETYKHKAGVAATARMYYPQFLFALDKIAEKRRSGFQEVVARVLSAIDTLPEPTFADFLIISGNQLEAGAKVPEFLTRHSLLPDNSKELRALADNDMIRKMKDESQDALNLLMGTNPKRATNSEGLKAFLESKRTGTSGGTSGGGDSAQQAGGADASNGGGRQEEAAAAAAALQASVYSSLPPPTLEPETLRQKKWERPEPSELLKSRAAALSRGVAPVFSPDTMHLVRELDPDQLMASLKRVYELYAAWGGGVDRTALDRRRFAKALRDALLVSESGPLPTRKAEAVYDKVLPASSRALNFIQFIEALRHVALHHRLSLNEVIEKLVAVGGPRPGP